MISGISKQELSKLKELFVVPDESVTIWRYVDFAKFVDLLETRCLFFARVDKLGDDFEGSCPKANLRYRLKEHRKVIGGANIEADDISAFYKRLREFTAAMWTLYLKSNEGIALRSSYRRLRDSFIDQKACRMIYRVHYIDYDKDTMSINLLAPFLHKRKSFEHESELRAIIQELPTERFKGSRRPFDTGIRVPINLDVLIDKIHVAPQTPDWQFNLVKSLVRKYGLQKEVIRSILDEKPIY
jgi:hypothetical protein